MIQSSFLVSVMSAELLDRFENSENFAAASRKAAQEVQAQMAEELKKVIND